METSEALQSYAQEKIKEKLLKFVTKTVDTKVSFSVDHKEHVAHVQVIGGDGFTMDVSATCTDMYGSVDLLVDKLSGKLKKHKEKLKNHKKVSNIRNLPIKQQWDQLDSDAVPIDAEDLIKYEMARKARRAS
jgi:putative sigma-54 modulation protein